VLDHDLVIGRGEFTITLEHLVWSWVGCTGRYAVHGALQAEPALRELIAGSGGAQRGAGMPIRLYDYDIASGGRVELQLSAGGPTQVHVIRIADIRGREADGVPGFLLHDDPGITGFLCRCRVSRR
jgi:hypothetical protein